MAGLWPWALHFGSSSIVPPTKPIESNRTFYRVWIRGCDINGTLGCAPCKNVVYEINSPAGALNLSLSNFNDVSFGSNHPGGANFVFCDGSVRFLTNSTPILLLKALASRNSGEVASQ